MLVIDAGRLLIESILPLLAAPPHGWQSGQVFPVVWILTPDRPMESDGGRLFVR
ncbi:MAG: hypothetical protein AAGF31_01200 [Planctomycetota bacterium]